AAVALEEGQFEISAFDGLVGSRARGETSTSAVDVTGAANKTVPPILLTEAVEQAERQAVARALAQCRGNRSKAAQQLGIDRTSLYKRLRNWGWDERRVGVGDAGE